MDVNKVVLSGIFSQTSEAGNLSLCLADEGIGQVARLSFLFCLLFNKVEEYPGKLRAVVLFKAGLEHRRHVAPEV